jgi:hypothetical protein
MRHAIIILKSLDHAFPLSATLSAETRGRTFTPSVLRGFQLLLGHTLLWVIHISGELTDFQGRGANPKNRAAYSLNEIKSIGLEVLRNLRDNPLSMPPLAAPQNLTEAQWSQYRYQCHFGAYHFAEAYMLYLP